MTLKLTKWHQFVIDLPLINTVLSARYRNHGGAEADEVVNTESEGTAEQDPGASRGSQTKKVSTDV